MPENADFVLDSIERSYTQTIGCSLLRMSVRQKYVAFGIIDCYLSSLWSHRWKATAKALRACAVSLSSSRTRFNSFVRASHNAPNLRTSASNSSLTQAHNVLLLTQCQMEERWRCGNGAFKKWKIDLPLLDCWENLSRSVTSFQAFQLASDWAPL